VKRHNLCKWTVVLLAVLLPLAACSRDPEARKRDHVARGDKYVEQNKLAEAVVEYRNAISIDARYGDARWKLGQVYERQRDLPNAYRQYVRAADLLPDNDEVQLRTGQFQLAAGQFDQAKRIAENLLKKNPRNVPAKVLQANAMGGLKDIGSAISELEAAVELDPKRVDSYLNLAAYQAANGDTTQAEAILRSAITLNPSSVEARLGLANIYWAKNDLVKAEAALKDALAMKPGDPVTSQALANIYLRTGRAKDAEAPLRAVADSTKAVGARLGLARYYLGTNRTADALPVLNALIKEPDGLVPASMLLARVDYVEGRRAEAHRRIDQLLVQQPTNAQVLVLKARFLADEGKLDEALTRAQSAVAADAKLSAAQYVIGLLYLQKNDTAQALKAFNEVLKLDPTSTATTLQVANIQLRLARADLAVPLADSVVTKEPNNLNARLTLVRALVASGDLKRAETEAAALLARAPNSGDAEAVVGVVASIKKDSNAARAAFNKALEMNPASVAALSGLLRLDLEAGKPAEARARLDKTLAARPTDPMVLELAGRTYMSLGDTKKAEEVWRRLLEVQPSSLMPYAGLGQIFYSQGRLDEARREFERFAEKMPTAVGAQTLVGMILQMQNRIPEAQKRYERTLEIDPNAAVAANNLAWLYAEQNTNLDVALQLAQTAKTQMPNSPEVDDTLGWIYYKKGLAGLAIMRFESALSKDPENPSYLYRLGLAQLKNGDKVKARDALQKALKAKGNFPEANEARRVLATLG
jgi:putative PEP-CTERM system TPR-repeat lipoprotein